MVRPKRRKPNSVPKKPQPIEVWVEAVDESLAVSCSPRVRVTLYRSGNGYQGDLRFEQATRGYTVGGFRIYATPRGGFTVITCLTNRVSSGDTLTLTLSISEGPVLVQLKKLGLKVY
jgi:hypothetical protein